jgi:hypothetical protein
MRSESHAIRSMNVTEPRHGTGDPAQNRDCGCGCNGAGDCEEAKGAPYQNRRSLLIGAGTVAFVSTLVNRRAFAAGGACDPVSAAMSMHTSGGDPKTVTGCSGRSASFWQTHVGCAAAALGFNGSWYDTPYLLELSLFLTSLPIGKHLPNLALVDGGCASQSYGAAFTNPGRDACHWACAALNAMSPTLCPNYAYNLEGLNNSILTAYKQGVPSEMILAALISLESDVGSESTGCANVSLSSVVS